MMFEYKNKKHESIPFSLEDKKHIEDFRKAFPNQNKVWMNSVYRLKISLKEIHELLDGVSGADKYTYILSEGEIIEHPIAENMIESLDLAILEQLPHEQAEDEIIFLISDVINWFEANAETNPLFLFRLNPKFVAKYQEMHRDFISYDDQKQQMELKIRQIEDKERRASRAVAELENKLQNNKKKLYREFCIDLHNIAYSLDIEVDIPFAVSVFHLILDYYAESYPDIREKLGLSYNSVSRNIKSTNYFVNAKQGQLPENKKTEKKIKISRVFEKYKSNIERFKNIGCILKNLLKQKS